MSSKPKIGIFATHPIQYQIPWYLGLIESKEIELKVYYAMVPDAQQQSVGFGKAFTWDIPMLEGYTWECLESHYENPKLNGFMSNSVRSLVQKFEQDALDAIIITGWHAWPMLQALYASAILGMPRIVRGESNAMRPRKWHAKSIHKLLLPLYDAYLAIGKSSASFFNSYNLSRDRIFVTPYFVDNQRFLNQAEKERPKRKVYREKWEIPEQAKCFLYVGKLEPKKRIFDALDALKLCLERTTEIHLLVVGAGELENEAKSQAQAQHLPVTFAGFLNQTEISSAYVAADVFVLPSDYGETWGLVVNEAMVSGLPAIVSDRVGCGPDLIANERTGCVFPFADTEALSETMLKFVEFPEMSEIMGAAARDWVLAHSNVEKAVKGTLAAIKSIL